MSLNQSNALDGGILHHQPVDQASLLECLNSTSTDASINLRVTLREEPTISARRTGRFDPANRKPPAEQNKHNDQGEPIRLIQGRKQHMNQQSQSHKSHR